MQQKLSNFHLIWIEFSSECIKYEIQSFETVQNDLRWLKKKKQYGYTRNRMEDEKSQFFKPVSIWK